MKAARPGSELCSIARRPGLQARAEAVIELGVVCTVTG